MRTALPMLLATVTLGLSAPSRVGAQSAPVIAGAAGVWSVRFDYQPRMQNGKAPPLESYEAQLTLRANKDSLFGEWQRSPAKGDTVPPLNVIGVQRGDSVFLRLIPIEDKQAGILAGMWDDFAQLMRTYVHGMPPTVTAINVLQKGNAIAGYRQNVQLDGTPAGVRTTVSATRVK